MNTMERLFPSPRGDELFQATCYIHFITPWFPSPRGDELFLMKAIDLIKRCGTVSVPSRG